MRWLVGFVFTLLMVLTGSCKNDCDSGFYMGKDGNCYERACEDGFTMGDDGLCYENGDSGEDSDADADADADTDADTDTDVEGVDFACGDATCDSSVAYCYEVIGGVPPDSGEKPDSNGTCTDFPKACLGDPSCTCLDSQGITQGGTCTGDVTTGVYVTVYAP